MINAQNTKFVKVYDSVSIGAADPSVAVIDTLGYDYCSIYMYAGVTGGQSVLKVQEGELADKSDAANFSNENGVFGFGESGQLNIDGTSAADPDATNSVVYEFQVDCKKRMRYLTVAATNVGTTVMAIFAVLSRGEDIGNPDVLANIGVTGCIRA